MLAEGTNNRKCEMHRKFVPVEKQMSRDRNNPGKSVEPREDGTRLGGTGSINRMVHKNDMM